MTQKRANVLSGGQYRAVLTALAAFLVIAGVVLLLDIGGAAKFVIRHLTSKNLGTLAPGYAASRDGFRAYAVLVLAPGIVTGGLALAPASPVVGLWIMVLGALVFVIASVVAIVGEVQTYRALPRRQGDRQAD